MPDDLTKQLAEALRELVRMYFGNEEFDKPGYRTVNRARTALAAYDAREEREPTQTTTDSLARSAAETHRFKIAPEPEEGA